MSDCMWEVGDTITFTPSSYAGNSEDERSKVKGTVVEVNEDRRWYRVEWKPMFDRPQHECFKF